MSTDPVNSEFEQKVLGLIWDYKNDSFCFKPRNIYEVSRSLPPTKRGVLGLLARIYDPLGHLAPAIIPLKLFQSLCEMGYDWDTPMSDALKDKHFKWLDDLKDLEAITVRRCYFIRPTNFESIEVHGFADSSTVAFASVVYLRVIYEGEIDTMLVISKNKIAPIKRPSVPRLELLAALITSRLVHCVKEALETLNRVNINKVYFWSDSFTTLFWIKGVNKQWKLFVENRVQDIRELAPPDRWFYCSTDDNPADIPTRGLEFSKLRESSKWWFGPFWLRLPEASWPDQPEVMKSPTDECISEMKAEDRKLFKTAGLPEQNCGEEIIVMQAEGKRVVIDSDSFINYERYGTYSRLLRVVCYVLHFIRNLRDKAARRKPSLVGELCATELHQAELYILKDIQHSIVTDKNYGQLMKQLNLILDSDGLIRAKGRLSYSDLTYDTKFPILIPSRNLVTTLIIKECHKAVQHNGVKETLCQLRTKYWVCKARQRIKTILSSCITCKKHSQKPYSEPLTAQLPDYRVTGSVPFSTCGIDFAGPFYVRHSKEVISDKVYLCLYTCASSRAVYLDLSTDLTAEAFIRSFKRFSARRGFPQRVISDNAKNFKSANQQLSALFELPSVQRYLAEKRVRWQFNLDRASWYGGIFERLIKSVKTCLKKVIGRARLTYDELLTVIVECETIINSRPLTFVYSDDVEEPLTPGHLLHGRRILSLPEVADVTVQELNRENMTRRAKYLSTLLVHFWRRWKKEDLVGLREYHRMKSLNAGQEVIQEGDVVSIHDRTLKKGFWRLGLVESLIRGRDQEVRGAEVKVCSKGRKPCVIKRPLQLLFPLELHSDLQMDNQPIRERPRRQAAVIGELKRKLVDQ